MGQTAGLEKISFMKLLLLKKKGSASARSEVRCEIEQTKMLSVKIPFVSQLDALFDDE